MQGVSALLSLTPAAAAEYLQAADTQHPVAWHSRLTQAHECRRSGVGKLRHRCCKIPLCKNSKPGRSQSFPGLPIWMPGWHSPSGYGAASHGFCAVSSQRCSYNLTYQLVAGSHPGPQLLSTAASFPELGKALSTVLKVLGTEAATDHIRSAEIFQLARGHSDSVNAHCMPAAITSQHDDDCEANEKNYG